MKHLQYQLIMDATDHEIKQNEQLKITTINELKKVEDEIRLILSKNN